MFNALTALGWGVITFAITIGVGTVVLTKFGDGVAECGTGFTYSVTNQTCQNDTLVSDTADPTNAGWVNTDYLNTQLGTTGLAGWTPAIIAFAVGMLFLGGFLINRGGKRNY
jgi:hypothetical protein